MTLKTWISRLFSSRSRDEEAAAREEYGLPDRGEAELERAKLGSRPGSAAAADVAEADVDELERR